ncbi:MAG: helix-turn-helix domain-containing protein [Thermoplasmataceae archaeon]
MGNLIAQRDLNRKNIEKTIATSKKEMTLTEIAESVSLPLPTTKRHLDYLESIGRLHVEEHRGSKLYKWNGVEKYQYKISISKDHTLYIDTMVNDWGQPFLRVKERKNGNDIGAIIIPKNYLDSFLENLKNAKENLPDYVQNNQ